MTTSTRPTGPIAWFAANPVAANLLMAFIVAAGIAGALRVSVQHLPEIDLRTVAVTVPFPGASPREVDEDVNRRLEDRLIGLAGIERVTAWADESLARVEVHVAPFARAEVVLDRVRDAVDAIEAFPPAAAERPEIELRETTLEVLTLAVSSATAGESALRDAADRVRRDLLGLPAVSLADLRGTRDREITVSLDRNALARHGLSFREVRAAIRNASIHATFGEVETGAGSFVLHTDSRRRHGAELEDVPVIIRPDGTLVTLGEVARIRDGFAAERIATRVDGRPAILVRVEATESQSIVAVAREVRAWLGSYTPPGGVRVAIWNDHARPTADRIRAIARNAIAGLALVVLCLVVAFDLRTAIWVAAGIPLSFAGALAFFEPAGLTINMATIFGLFLLVGIVVDDAIVVGESIAAEREGGKEGVEAAVAGARAVAAPVGVGLATTILGFAPLLFVTEGAHQIVKVFPLVAFFVLAVSFVEAFLVLPAHLAHGRPWSRPPMTAVHAWAARRLDRLRDQVVGPAVSWAVRNVAATLLAGTAAVVIGFGLLYSEHVRIIVFDARLSVSGNVQADIELPAGVPFEATLATAERFARAGERVNERLGHRAVASIGLMAGARDSASVLDFEQPIRSHVASVRLKLAERPERTASPSAIARLWREEIGDTSDLAGVVYSTTRVRTQPSIAYAVRHEDEATLAAATRSLREGLESIPGLYSVADNQGAGKRHLEVRLTRRGEAAGLTPAAVGAQLRARYAGREVQRIQREGEEIRIVLRYPSERRRMLEDLGRVRIRVPGGGSAPLAALAELVETRGPAQLVRIDGRRAALVGARADSTRVTPLAAEERVEREIVPDLMAKYPGLTLEPHGGSRAARDMLRTLAVLVPLALVAMYMLMAGFLRSYWKPLVAVAGIPMAFTGAVVGHWILGWYFTAMSLFGVIGVAGVVVNDALVLLDRYNRIRREEPDLPAIAAAAAATRHRFRAVLLTSVTTVVGLAPLLYERSDALVALVPLVVSILGGLVLASAFTLFVLPALVMLVEGRRE